MGLGKAIEAEIVISPEMGGKKKGNLNPFDQEQIIICSYHFLRAKEPYIVSAGLTGIW